MPVYLVHCVEFERSLVSAIFCANPALAALLREPGGASLELCNYVRCVCRCCTGALPYIEHWMLIPETGRSRNTFP